MLINKRGQSGMNLAALVLAAAMQKDHEFWFQISEGVRVRPLFAHQNDAFLRHGMEADWLLAASIVAVLQDKDTFVSSACVTFH